MRDPNTLQTIWFLLICILWIGFFILEGFDFGVGMLIRAAARDDAERRAVLHSIGPVWDGNEVWLLTAGGATFAAFPGWYASLFSGFYLALFLILVCLIVRGVAFEFWGKHDTPQWRARWEWALAISSGGAALLFGVGWANIVRGVPMNAKHDVTGNLFDLLGPYALLGGLTTLALFLAHGATFLSLRTTGAVEQRSRDIAEKAAPLAAVLVAAFMVWTLARQGGVELGSALFAAGAVAAGAVAATFVKRSPGRAFAASCMAILLLFAALFADLWPLALPSTTSHANDLGLAAASSTHYTLKVMTVVAAVMVPIVLAYQAWTYWVFRKRLSSSDFELPKTITGAG